MNHYFLSTNEACDACQCDPTVNTGDLLVIPSEDVVGVADTWPFAVTEQCGALHGVTDWDDKYLDHLQGCIAEARALIAAIESAK